MRPRSALFTGAAALALLLSPVRSQSQQTFQGMVTYDITTQGQTMRMVHYIKDGDLRVELESQGRAMVMLSDTETGRQIMLVPERKQWIDMKAMQERMGEMMGRAGRGAPAPTAARGPVDFRATGQSETVAGIRCEHYLIVSESGEMDVCAAKGLGWQTGAVPTMGAPGAARGRGAEEPPAGLSDVQVAMLRQRFADGFFPLKITSAANGREVTIHVVELTREAVADAMFEPPSDYQEMRIPGGAR